MSGQSPMSNQPSLWDIPNATSLPAADSGVLLSGKPAGPTSANAGRGVARAPASARREKVQGLETLVTSGRIGWDSSASAALQSSLESRLVPRLDTVGSTLFRLTWRHKTTPLGRRYLERAASVLRTSGKGFTSWRSPNARLNGGGDYSDPVKAAKRLEQGHQLNLSEEVLISSWPTPMAADVSRVEMDRLKKDRQTRNPEFLGSYRYELPDAARMASWATPRNEDSESPGAHRGMADTLTSQTSLAGWARPAGCDWKDSPGMAETGVNPDGSERTRLDQLPRQAGLAGWPQGREQGIGIREQETESAGREAHATADLEIGATTPSLAGWPTCAASDGNGGKGPRKGMSATGRMPDGMKATVDLSAAAKMLAGWPTPMAGSPATESYNEAGNNDSSRRTVELASWPTPNAMEGGQTSRGGDRKNEALMSGIAKLASWATPSGNVERGGCQSQVPGSTRPSGAKVGTTLQHQVLMSGWPTPTESMVTEADLVQAMTAGNSKDRMSYAESKTHLCGPVRLTAGGQMLTGSDAGMESGGQLNPAHSRWLMGAPPEWDGFGCTAMQSVSLRRKRLSNRALKQ